MYLKLIFGKFILRLFPNKNIAKAETFTLEGYTSSIRHYLARFKGKTKCYSKSKSMLEISLKLLFAKLNGLAIF